VVDEPLLVWPSDGGRSALCSADIPWDPTNRGRDSYLDAINRITIDFISQAISSPVLSTREADRLLTESLPL
jgi:hypothetical protein